MTTQHAKSNAREGDGVAGLRPIERDEAFDRDYIPLPGGWEIQTKGKGSTFRICDPNGDRLPIPDSPYLHETLTRMGRGVHAAISAMQAQQGAEPVAWQYRAIDPTDVMSKAWHPCSEGLFDRRAEQPRYKFRALIPATGAPR